MSYTAYTQPNSVSAGYSAIPLRVSSTDSQNFKYFKYVINIAYEPEIISATTTTTFENSVCTTVTFTTAHEYEVGYTLMLIDNTGYYDGYYDVKSVPSSTSVIIDLSLDGPLTGGTFYNVIKYKMSPDLEGEAKLDISNTLKDFVTQNLEDVNDIFAGPDTKFDYKLIMGQESNYVFNFEDNGVSGGKTIFWNSSLPSTYTATTLPFQIGDYVLIEQDLFEWNYTGTFLSGGLAFSSTTNIHNFLVGQTVNVTGQITNPENNGITTVNAVVDNYAFSTLKNFNIFTPDEPGIIYGIPRPTYNTTAQITDIYWTPSLGVVVKTDIPFAGASQPIPGTMRLINDEKTTSFNDLAITGLTAYNARINTLNYGFTTTQFAPYVMNLSGPLSGNNISTILSGATRYRIEQSTKSWLLFHQTSNAVLGAEYTFYNSAGSELAQAYIPATANYTDFYAPVGIDQLIACSSLVTTGSSISSVASSIDYYKIEASDNRAKFSNPIYFELNDDCSSYDIFHLMWKDAYGSWLSYPFKYISEDRMEVERKDFYQTEGKWNLDNNTFGYDTFGRGQKSFFVRTRDKYVLNSGWIDDHENVLMKDLMSSAAVYLQLPDGMLIAANIVDKDIQLKKRQSDYIWNYRFDVTASINENRF